MREGNWFTGFFKWGKKTTPDSSPAHSSANPAVSETVAPSASLTKATEIPVTVAAIETATATHDGPEIGEMHTSPAKALEEPASLEQQREAILDSHRKLMPPGLHRLLSIAAAEMTSEGLIPFGRPASPAIAERLAEEPGDIERLRELIYASIAEEFRFFPEKDIVKFANKIISIHHNADRMPDCSAIAAHVRDAIEKVGGKACSIRFRAKGKNGEYQASQFVIFICLEKEGEKYYYAADQAAWFYGANVHPWYYVVEGKSVEEVYSKLLTYFRKQAEDRDDCDRKTWETDGEGNEAKNVRTIKFLLETQIGKPKR